jgi:hypothetical protein
LCNLYSIHRAGPPANRAFRQCRLHDRWHELRCLDGGVRPGGLPRLPAPCEQLLRRKPMPARNFGNHCAGTSVSSIIRALSSAENQRRRPDPVITSSRRAVVASGLSVWSSVDTTRSLRFRDRHTRRSQTSGKGAVKTTLTLLRVGAALKVRAGLVTDFEMNGS